MPIVFSPGRLRSLAVVCALFATVTGVSFLALREFRAAGVQPSFYQTNFESAVLMACGRGFGLARPAPEALRAFLDVRQDRFDCANLPPAMAVLPLTSAAHASWYYLYGTTAAVWRVAGISWTALDGLAATLGGIAALLLYGLFRLVAGAGVAFGAALILSLSPSTLSVLLSLRDFSKAPFVLAAILILAVLVLRPLSRQKTLALAGGYGAVVGLGYGFRGDLAIMVPFGALVTAAFLPPLAHGTLVRNTQAAGLLLLAFLACAYPVLSGLKYGGCQFHFALLGLTTPLTSELRLTPPLYQFGDHLTDAFVDLKVGDYSSRVLGAAVPNLCTADYDTSSGQLFRRLAMTFPADLVVRAYASVLMILRVGLSVPDMMQPSRPFPSHAFPAMVYRAVNRVTAAVAPAGPLLTLIAVAMAFASSVRLGLAMTLFVLFLTGYPAIQFEARHWFHLRFIPWWAAMLVAAQVWQWRGHGSARAPVVRVAAAAAGVVVVLGLALGIVRLVQDGPARALVSAYLSAETEPIATVVENAAFVRVQWQPDDFGTQPGHRGSDLLVVTLDPNRCAGAASATIRARYDADLPSHDLSSDIVASLSAPGAAPTRVFLPVFWLGFESQTHLRFAGLEVAGAPVECVTQVARVVNRASLPLWIQMQVAADWSGQPLYQSMRAPRLLSR